MPHIHKVMDHYWQRNRRRRESRGNPIGLLLFLLVLYLLACCAGCSKPAEPTGPKFGDPIRIIRQGSEVYYADGTDAIAELDGRATTQTEQIAYLQSEIERLDKRIEQIAGSVGDLESRMGDRFAAVSKRIDALERQPRSATCPDCQPQHHRPIMPRPPGVDIDGRRRPTKKRAELPDCVAPR